MDLLETPRLLLRPFTLEDVEAAFQMNLDQEVSRYTGDGGVVSYAEIEQRIKDDVLGDYEKYGYGRFAVEWKENGEFIGFAGLKYLEDIQEVDLGYRLLRAYWGKGIATEAGQACIGFGFRVLGLNRMIAMLLPGNKASVRVLQKLGFNFEKEFTEDDLLVHQYCLALDDWRKLDTK